MLLKSRKFGWVTRQRENYLKYKLESKARFVHRVLHMCRAQFNIYLAFWQ